MFVQQEKPTLVENKKSDSEPLNTETTEVKIANNYEDRLKSASGLGERQDKILQHFPTPKFLLTEDKQTILFGTGVGTAALARIHKKLQSQRPMAYT